MSCDKWLSERRLESSYLFTRLCQSKLLRLQSDQNILNRQISHVARPGPSQSGASLGSISLQIITGGILSPRKWNITNNGNIKISSRSSSMLLFLAGGHLDSIVSTFQLRIDQNFPNKSFLEMTIAGATTAGNSKIGAKYFLKAIVNNLPVSHVTLPSPPSPPSHDQSAPIFCLV